jgi:hypothetical protein
MARTVTVHDPATGSTFRATRLQWNRLHQPAGCELVADENGAAPERPKAKTTKPEADTGTNEE